MALLFCDGFDSYAATADLIKKWSSNDSSLFTWASSGGPSGGGGNCISVASASGGSLRKQGRDVNSSRHNDTVMFWFKFSAVPASSIIFFQFLGGSGAPSLKVTSTGKLQATCTGGGLTATTTASYCDNAWHHAELQSSYSGSINTLTLRIDNAQVLVAVDNTGSSQFTDTITFFNITAAVTFSLDDVIWYDDSGSSFNTFPVGMRTIETLRPSAAGDETDMTKTGGATNYQSVNEANSDGDSTYVSDTVAGHYDLYNFGNLSGTPATIDAVVVNNHARSAGGIPTIRAKAKSGTTIADGSSVQVPAQAYTMKQEAFVVDPNTSAAWAAAGVNGAQFGVELVS